MKKQASSERAERAIQQEKAPGKRDNASSNAATEGDLLTGSAIGAALGGFSAGAGGAAIGGAIGMIGGALGGDEKKSR
jgi:hypothetical protein